MARASAKLKIGLQKLELNHSFDFLGHLSHSSFLYVVCNKNFDHAKNNFPESMAKKTPMHG